MIYDNYSYLLLDTLPEQRKLQLDYLMANMDNAISYLVYDKQHERRWYNLHNGIRDVRELQHLTDNYGVGVPTKIPFVPIMRKRINAIANKTLQSELDFHVTSANERAIDYKLEERRVKMFQEMSLEMNKNMQKGQFPVIRETFMQQLREKYGSHWQADFEVAAQNYIHFFIEKKQLKKQFHQHMIDFCVAGQMYRRDFIRQLGKNPETWVINPEDFWCEYNPNSIWVEDSRRCVYRRWMTPTAILRELGHYMTEADREKIARTLSGYYNEKYRKEILFTEGKDLESIALSDTPRYEADLLEVFHHEWITTNPVKLESKEDFILAENSGMEISPDGTILQEDRYEAIKINVAGGVYAFLGKSKYVAREHDDPYRCKLSYNGLVYYYRNGMPYSMTGMTRDVQNMYDITYFHLNNLLAAARPGGTFTIMEHIPKFMGKTPLERLMKNTGYEKTLSQKIVSLTQEGQEGPVQFNNYGNYPTNLDGQLVQAFKDYLQVLEVMADSIVGLNPRLLGEMEERDGKGTTMMAIENGEMITKDLYYNHTLFFKKTLTNVLNLARLSFSKKPFTAAHTIGKDFNAFTLLPESFSMMDFNIFITDEAFEKKVDAKLDEYANVALQSGVADLKLVMDILTSRSITAKKDAIFNAQLAAEEKAGKQLEQTQQQMQQMQQELQQAQQLIKKYEDIAMNLKQRQMALEERRLNEEISLKRAEIGLDTTKVSNENENEKSRIKAEILQLYDDNPRNDEVRNR